QHDRADQDLAARVVPAGSPGRQRPLPRLDALLPCLQLLEPLLERLDAFGDVRGHGSCSAAGGIASISRVALLRQSAFLARVVRNAAALPLRRGERSASSPRSGTGRVMQPKT